MDCQTQNIIASLAITFISHLIVGLWKKFITPKTGIIISDDGTVTSQTQK